ncbi:hypothetical protein HGRIS_007839 [Hohenbuehelia grisea]|uniref:Uncharacterized protein n=1 Tax=Hohenbuehelia grisea TaxID=104357 RepID=A0ABR3J6B6_9AGAR
MPVPGFLASFADKAQSAINASPLAAHLPSHGRSSSPDAANQPPANQAAAQGGPAAGSRSHAMETIQYQLRAFQQQYSSSTLPVQKIITSAKGVAIDFDSVSRDAKGQSKEMYTWGQGEGEDLKDVTDRLAYLNFVQGSLAASLAQKLDAARAPLKALRDAESALTPRRNARAGLQTQLARIEHDQQRGMEKKIAELKEQIKKAEADDAPQEKELEILKRKALRESELFKWEAIREYGEKLVLLSQASNPIIGALPTIPPTPGHPYSGHQATGAARASLQRALDNYKTGHINLPPQSAGSDLSRSDTRSFGETHASELSSMTSETPASSQLGLPLTPPAGAPVQGTFAVPEQHSAPGAAAPKFPEAHHDSSSNVASSPPINPMALNQSPASIPGVSPFAGSPSSSAPGMPHPTGAPIVVPDPTRPVGAQMPTITPTVAETGVPVTAGADGPGPASGSLHDIKAASPSAGPRSGGLPGNDNANPTFGSPAAAAAAAGGAVGAGALAGVAAAGGAAPKFESAEEEKQRLQREDRERVLRKGGATQPGTTAPAAPGGVAAHSESAEDEKKRLEREERERLLNQGSAGQQGEGRKDEDLPPYQDY